MNLDDIRVKAVPVLSSAGVTRSSLFGSVVKGDFSKNSDVDFLVEFPRGKTLLDLVDLKLKLEKVLGKRVDVLTFKSVSPHLKESILGSQHKII